MHITLIMAASSILPRHTCFPSSQTSNITKSTLKSSYSIIVLYASLLLLNNKPCSVWARDELVSSPAKPCSSHLEFPFAEEDGTTSCHPLLDCPDLSQMKPVTLLARGVVKNVWLVEWRRQLLVMSRLANPLLIEDFTANLQNLLYFRESGRVIRLLGHCGNGTIFTEYHPKGNALGLQALFARHRIDSFVDRFQLCVDYAQILALLHRHQRVMCDSNSVAKTLTQYLVSEHFNLILNDLDALPRLNELKQTKCGRRQVSGDLVAPEQQWPFPDRPFDDSLMPPYNEKTDIWKIPDICHWIVGDEPRPASPLARHLLRHLHRQCKLLNPQQRPSAMEVVRLYQLISQLS